MSITQKCYLNKRSQKKINWNKPAIINLGQKSGESLYLAGNFDGSEAFSDDTGATCFQLSMYT